MGGSQKLANGVPKLNGISKDLIVRPARPEAVSRLYSALALLGDVLWNAIPYLSFLFVYGINGHVHILPRASDSDCVYLYNVSAFETGLLGFAPHKLVSSLVHPALDVLAAVPYLLHYVIPVIFPLYEVVIRGRPEVACQFYRLLGAAMWLHFLVWFFLPTAPPWLYANREAYLGAELPIPPIQLQHKEGCAFARLDALTGIPFFFNMFDSNPVPFGSFPSGHVCWPMCILATAPPGGRLFAIYIVWVTWATLYSCHHYVSDAVMAILIVLVTKRLQSLLCTSSNPRRRPCCDPLQAVCGWTVTKPAVVCPFNIV